MKYHCNQCSFKWNGYLDSFEEVIQHEKIHHINEEE